MTTRIRFTLLVLLVLVVATSEVVKAEPFNRNPQFDRHISVSFRNVDIVDVLKAFSEDYGINIVIEEDIKGTVTANFDGAEVGDALDAILSMVGCGWEQRGNVILVFQSRPVRKVFTVDYTMDDAFRVELENLLSDTGKLIVDPASSRVMVIDKPVFVETVGEFLSLGDPARRQVMIEARIVEVTLDRNDELGIDWSRIDYSLAGMDGLASTAVQNLAPQPGGEAGQPSDWGGFEFAVSHERASFLLQAIAKNTNLDLLSAPKIATLNNRRAVIEVIEKIPYIKTSTDIAEAGFISTQQEVEFEEVGIKLEATPQIAPDGTVFLKIRPEVSEVTEWYDGQPVVDKRSVETNIRVGDGETIIIGGLLKDGTTQTMSKVPLLGDIPGLRIFFRHKAEVVRKTELLIFISPRILTGTVAAADAEEGEQELEELRGSIKTGLLR
jgi:type II secretory pathway component GspD/PulD (secretin)